MESNPQPPVIDRLPASRFMGLDVGDRKIGIAISDERSRTAQPLLTLIRQNRRQDLRALARLMRKHGCSQIVVGNPLYMSGDLSPQAAKAQSFAQALREETDAPVHLWDERLSTTEAHRHLDLAGRKPSTRRAVIDQVAAVLILQSFLDARRARGPSQPSPETEPASSSDERR